MNQLCWTIGLLILTLVANANTWQSTNLQYSQQINGKSYIAHVTLMRPTDYFVTNNVTKAGDNLVVNLPEIGLDNINMQVISISPYKGIASKDTNGNTKYEQIDEINWNNKKQRPVIGTFKRYAPIVNTYTFINAKTKELSKINATPEHLFYVVSKQQYVPIAKITPDDKLVSYTGDLVNLVCPNYPKTCGIRYNTDNKPIQVYNLEVYQQHRYLVTDKNTSNNILLVHNAGCGFSNIDPISRKPIEPNSKKIIQLVTKNENGYKIEPVLYYKSSIKLNFIQFVDSDRPSYTSLLSGDNIVGYVKIKNQNAFSPFNNSIVSPVVSTTTDIALPNYRMRGSFLHFFNSNDLKSNHYLLREKILAVANNPNWRGNTRFYNHPPVYNAFDINPPPYVSNPPPYE